MKLSSNEQDLKRMFANKQVLNEQIINEVSNELDSIAMGPSLLSHDISKYILNRCVFRKNRKGQLKFFCVTHSCFGTFYFT